MSILRRHLAPITPTGWKEIDGEARSVLQSNLVTRRFVDVEGPHGWSHSAVNLGSLDEIQEQDMVRWGLRQVQPLIEFRVPFVVDRWSVDNLERGAVDVDLDTVRAAALAAARFEARVVYHGLPAAGIVGLCGASDHGTVSLGRSGHDAADAVAAAMVKLTDAGVDGPYLLLLGENEYRRVASDQSGYPLRQQLAKLVGSAPVYSPGLDGGLLLSTRGGDFPLTLGVDVAIGFDRADGEDVHLFLTESFTFRVTGAEAVVVLPADSSGTSTKKPTKKKSTKKKSTKKKSG